eukprot:2639908-Rhodomonas_salina.2
MRCEMMQAVLALRSRHRQRFSLHSCICAGTSFARSFDLLCCWVCRALEQSSKLTEILLHHSDSSPFQMEVRGSRTAETDRKRLLRGTAHMLFTTAYP